MRWVLNSWFVLRSISIDKLLIHARRCQAWCWGNQLMIKYNSTKFGSYSEKKLSYSTFGERTRLSPILSLSPLFSCQNYDVWTCIWNEMKIAPMLWRSITVAWAGKNAGENLQRGFYSRTWRLEFIQVRYFETNNRWKVLIFTGNKQIQRWRTQFCWLRLQKLFNAKSDNTTSACLPNFSTQTNTSTPQMVFLRPKIVQRITDTSAE